jgi:hypothetical protein
MRAIVSCCLLPNCRVAIWIPAIPSVSRAVLFGHSPFTTKTDADLVHLLGSDIVDSDDEDGLVVLKENLELLEVSDLCSFGDLGVVSVVPILRRQHAYHLDRCVTRPLVCSE